MQSAIRAFETLEYILSTGNVVLIHRDDDGYYTGSAGRKHATAESLESFVDELSDNPRRKVCTKAECGSGGKSMPLSRFGPDPDSLDGRMSVCKACESKRVMDFKRRKKIESDLAAGHQDEPIQADLGVEAVVHPKVRETL